MRHDIHRKVKWWKTDFLWVRRICCKSVYCRGGNTARSKKLLRQKVPYAGEKGIVIGKEESFFFRQNGSTDRDKWKGYV